MRFVHQISAHPILSLFSATLVLQLGVLLSGYYLRSGTNRISSVAAHIAPAHSVEAEVAKPRVEGVAPVVTESIPVRQQGTRYKVQSGDTLTKIWIAHGGTYQGGIKASKALEAAGVALASIRVGEELEITRGPDEKDVVGFRKKISEGRIIVLSGNSVDGYKAEIIKREIVEKQRVVSGEILHSLSETAVALNLPYEVADDFVDLFSARLEFGRDIHPGDSFSVIFSDRVADDGETLEPGPIVAASLQTRGAMLAAIRYTGSDGEGRYYDEGGEPLGNYFLRYPVKFSRISSSFSSGRFHPVLKVSRPHNGVDFAAPTGTAVRTVADGVVVYAGYNGGSGKIVKVRHSDKYTTAYMHLSAINVRQGARVKRGDLIGKVGQTGLATGPHLHYSFYVNGRYVDPLGMKLPAMPVNGQIIPVTFHQEMMNTLEHTHQTLRMAANISPSKIG